MPWNIFPVSSILKHLTVWKAQMTRNFLSSHFSSHMILHGYQTRNFYASSSFMASTSRPPDMLNGSRAMKINDQVKPKAKWNSQQKRYAWLFYMYKTINRNDTWQNSDTQQLGNNRQQQLRQLKWKSKKKHSGATYIDLTILKWSKKLWKPQGINAMHGI